MKIRVFGCRKFSRLISDRADRTLSLAEERFLERHRFACWECRKSERSSDCALNMLRAAALDAEVAPMFEDRVIRRLRVQTVRDGLSYWSPALIGAAIACIALFVALHLAASPAQTGHATGPANEARREAPLDRAPDLELSDIPEFSR